MSPETNAGSDRKRLYIACFTGNSGLTHYSLSLARELQRHADVTLMVGESYIRQAYPPTQCRVVPLFRRSRWYPIDLLRFLTGLIKARPDVVAFQSVLKSATVEGFLIRLIRLLGIRVCITVHDVLPHYPRPWSRLSRRWFYQAADSLIAHSGRAKSDLVAMGVTRSIAVVPHGAYDLFITRSLDSQAARGRLTKFQIDDFVLLFFGKVDARKGIGSFLQLEKHLAGEGVRLVVAGSNGIRSHEQALQAALRAARASPNCLIRDEGIPFDEVQDYLALADVLVLPYLEGTTSGVLKLAVAAGKPVVATDIGDHAEALQWGIGVLVSAKSTAEELAEAVRTIRREYARYQTASRTAAQQFGWPAIANMYAGTLFPARDPG